VTEPQPDTVPREEELLAGLAHSVDGWFELLVVAYQGRLYRFALRYCASPEDAEEVTQDAFVRAYHALHGYTAARVRALSLRAWLYAIALNVARNKARGKRLRLVALDGQSPEHEPEDDAADRPESLVERAEGGRELGALVAALPEKYRAAVVLRHVEGLGYPEIAAVLGQPVGTVKSNAHRGVRLLREVLEPEIVESCE
jgi:RNA polymerase sigma-70 factor (ECF subfamily)